MKKNEWLSALRYAITDMIFFFPVVLLNHLYILKTPFTVSLMQYMLFFAVGYASAAYIPGLDRKLLRYIAAVVFGFALSASVQGWNWHGFAGSALGFAAVLRATYFVQQDREVLYPPQVFMTGLIVSSFVPLFVLRNELWIPYSGMATACGIASLIITLFSVNRYHLHFVSRTGGNRTFSAPAVIRNNQIWLTFTVLLVMAVGWIGPFRSAVQETIVRLGQSIIGFFLWIGSLFQQPSSPPPENGTPPNLMELLPEEAKSPSRWMVILVFQNNHPT
jgi:hypothetical protein